MKKLLLLLLLSLYSCQDKVKNNIVVEKVELESNSDIKTKYRVYLNTFPFSAILLTDKIYQVGDTIR